MRERGRLTAQAATRLGVPTGLEVTFERHLKQPTIAMSIRRVYDDAFIGSYVTIDGGIEVTS